MLKDLIKPPFSLNENILCDENLTQLLLIHANARRALGNEGYFEFRGFLFHAINNEYERQFGDLFFGDYCEIEQKRYQSKNEVYLYKVIGTSMSNSWVDVPVQTPDTEVAHKDIMPVVSCICCGVCETDVRKYLIKDVKKVYKSIQSVGWN